MGVFDDISRCRPIHHPAFPRQARDLRTAAGETCSPDCGSLLAVQKTRQRPRTGRMQSWRWWRHVPAEWLSLLHWTTGKEPMGTAAAGSATRIQPARAPSNTVVAVIHKPIFTTSINAQIKSNVTLITVDRPQPSYNCWPCDKITVNERQYR